MPTSGPVAVASARVPPPAAANSQPSTINPQPSLPPPIPDYELLRRIGSGSYGDVWLARNVLGQLRAVKVVYRSRFSEPRPFEREFEGIQRFEPISRSHPSQLHILHVGKNDAAGCFYYVMELADAAEPRVGSESVNSESVISKSVADAAIDSLNTDSLITDYSPRTLRSDLEAHDRLPIPDCVQIGLSLATALQHLHENKLVHRDIKPSNIIFVKGVAKLGDIGLVTEAGDTHSIVGTEGYLPPEGPGTPQADLFSLGKVLYEMSTGMDRRRFPKLPDDLPSWPDGREVTKFNEVVLRACAKDMEHRYASADALRADLELLQAGKPVRHARERQWLGSRMKKVAFGLVLLALVIVSFARLTRQIQPQRNEAAGDGPPSTNDLANALCAKGLLIIRGDQYPAFAEAYTNFHQAIRLDPCFARPWAGLFELRMGDYAPALPAFTTDELGEVTKKLIELAPHLAVTYCAQAVVAYCEPDYSKAREYARRATLADANYAPARATYGWFLTTWGWPKEGRKEIEAALRLRPSDSGCYQLLANTYYMERNFPKAIEVYREALRWESHLPIPYQGIAGASLAMGDPMTAISNLEQHRIVVGTLDAKSIAWFQELRQAVAEQGALGYWRKLAEGHAKKPEANFYSQAVCQMNLGNTNDALALLEKSFETHELEWILPKIYMLVIDRTWDGVRHNPQFQNLLDRIGFTKVMPKRR